MRNLFISAIITGIIFSQCSPAKKSVSVVNVPAEVPKQTPVAPQAKPKVPNAGNAFMVNLLKQYPQWFSAILKDSSNSAVQVLYTSVTRDAANKPLLNTHGFNADDSVYFYPATSVALPIAMLALQKIESLAARGVTINSTMITERTGNKQTAVYNDPFSPTGKPTVAGYIKRMLLQEDEEAFNRLYEFLGQQSVNDALQKIGFKEVQILERLGIFLTETENATTNPIQFLDERGNIMYSQPATVNYKTYPKRNDYLGPAYYSNGKLYNSPMMFSYKNKIALSSLHRLLQMLVLPNAFTGNNQLSINELHRSFLLDMLSANAAATSQEGYPSQRQQPVANILRSKFPNRNIGCIELGGKGYGQLTQVAYVTDLTNGQAYFLTATILANKKTVLNAGKYEYDEKAYPFLKNLALAIHEQEMKRPKNSAPIN